MQRMFATLFLTLLVSGSVWATATFPFSFNGEEVSAVIGAYAKATGEKFIVNPDVQGKITIFNSQPVTKEEAFSLMSTALANLQFAIVEQEGVKVVMTTRLAQRSFLPVLTELPPLKPERLVSLMIKPKYLDVEELNKRLRILPSRDGEMTPYTDQNTLIVTDLTSNLYRIVAIIEKLDQPKVGARKAKPTVKAKN